MPPPNAVALYAILDRDPEDFLDMIGEADEATLTDLYKMFSMHQPDADIHTKKTNELGKSFVKGQLERRGIELPEIPARYDHESYVTRGVLVSNLSLNEARDEVCRLTDVIMALGEATYGPGNILNDWRLGRAPIPSQEYLKDRNNQATRSGAHDAPSVSDDSIPRE